MSNQLIKKNHVEGYKNVFPKTFTDAIRDKESGVSLQEILRGFNMYFLSYNGNKSLTRCKVPSSIRKEGLWITYVLYDHTVVTEWYNSDNIDDDSWGDDSNWRVGSNALVGDVSISSDGYWVINGEKTETKAQGYHGVTPLIRFGENNKFQISYNDGKTWQDLSNSFTSNVRISKYIGINDSLPISGIDEGTIYMKGPYYDENDSLNENPIYRMWVYAWKDNTLAWQDNGEFTSISAGVVQEKGTSTTEIMSQDAVTRELTELESRTIGVEISVTGSGITTSGNIGLWATSCIFNRFTLQKGDSVQVTSLTYDACVIAKPTDDSTTPYQPLVNAVTNKPSLPQIYTYTANEDIEIVCSGSTADTKVIVFSPNSLLEKLSANTISIKGLDKKTSEHSNIIKNIYGKTGGNIFSDGWKIGSYYESIADNTSRRYKVVNVNVGERYRIENLSSEWGGYIYFADNNGVIDYLVLLNNMEIMVGLRNGRIPTEMRITIFYKPEKVLTDAVWADFKAKMYNLSKSPLCKPVVAEWNFGLLNNGLSPQRIEDDKVDEYLPKIKELITSLGADILYTTEYVKELDRSQKRNTYNEVLKQFYPYYYYGGNMMAIFSKYPFSVQSVTSPDGRNCELGFININGNVIGFGEIHPRSASGTEAEDARIADHQMIVDYFVDYDRVIVGGDFNNYEDRELDVYRNAGWNLGNCGYFGNIDTYMPSSRPWYIDNIVTKGINIDNFVKVDNRADISDHYPVVANLSFL